MKDKLNQTKHSMKMMWVCVAFAVLAIVLIASGVGGIALFLIPCMLMMGAIRWASTTWDGSWDGVTTQIDELMGAVGRPVQR